MLTQLLTMTTTHKFPSLVVEVLHRLAAAVPRILHQLTQPVEAEPLGVSVDPGHKAVGVVGHLEAVHGLDPVARAVDEGVTPAPVSPALKWKLVSCSHCQELCQQASWLLIGFKRVNNQSEAR